MSNTGGPAFPVPDIDGSAVAEGMTLRDYFAAKVLNVSCEDHLPNEAARIAYEYADAMLRARGET